MKAARRRSAKPESAPPPPESSSSSTEPVAADPDDVEHGASSKTNSSSSSKQKKLSFSLLALATLLLIYRVVSFAAEWNETASSSGSGDMEGEGNSKNPPKKVHLDQSGWSPQIGSLVDKRPPRPCVQTDIGAAMFDLLVYRTKKKEPRRAFACLEPSACREALMEDARDRQWKAVKSVDATFVFADAPSLAALPPASFHKLYFAREGSTYLDVIFGSGAALSTGDAAQRFGLLSAFTTEFGCDLNSLQVMLPQYRADEAKECSALRSQAENAPQRVVFAAGSETSLSASAVLARIGPVCPAPNPLLVTRQLAKPLLLDGKQRFTVRSYCLVASTHPFMVFFRRGFVVLEGGRGLPLQQFQRTLANGKITGTHFTDTFLQTSMKQITLLVFHASRRAMLRRRGSFQLFSLDFVVSEEMKIFLHSTSAKPALHEVRDGQMTSEMLDLVMELGEESGALARMQTGDRYGSFELIFSEVRETCEGAFGFNPCQKFRSYNAANLAKANKQISVTHNAANREHHEETRVVKKLEEEKKAKCKEKGFGLETRHCDKYAKAMEDEEFETLFAEHEKDWNPNAFKLAQPGEVFPWEMV